MSLPDWFRRLLELIRDELDRQRPSPSDPPPAPPREEDRLLELVNAERARRGVRPLLVDGRLTNAAREYARYLASIDRTRGDHKDGQGRSVGGRARDHGYAWDYVSENVAQTAERNASQAMRQWLLSPDHASAIRNGISEHVGIGLAEGPSGFYWVTVFGSLF